MLSLKRARKLKTLTPGDIEQFVEEGYVILRDAFSPDDAAQIRASLWEKLRGEHNVHQDDAITWKKGFVHLAFTLQTPAAMASITPKILGAFDDLTGEGRSTPIPGLGWFPVTFPGFHQGPWTPPEQGWHVDGSNFHHHIDSPEQGLLVIYVLDDIDPGGGGTAIVPGSHKHAARVLADAEPQGISAEQLGPAMRDCPREPVIEASGKAGDVVLLHPFMLHATSPNAGGRVRFICNPQLSLKEPMNLDRDETDDYSPVELAILRALEFETRPAE